MKFFIVIFILLFFSCSNSDNSDLSAYKEGETVRSEVIESKNNLEWVGEDVQNNSQNTNSKATLFNDWTSLFFFYSENNDAIYPSVDTFGSLNTASMPIGLYNVVNKFFSSLQEDTVSEDFFTEEKVYLKTIIRHSTSAYPEIREYLIGEYFAFDNPLYTYEVPVRLFFENGYADSYLYCERIESQYYIEQFSIGSIVYE